MSNELVTYVDHRGHQVVSNNEKEFFEMTQGNSSFVPEKLTGFNSGMAGKSGYNVETINGVKMFVSYAPILAMSTTSVVLSFEPYNHVFSAAELFTFECIYNESHSWWGGSNDYIFAQQVIQFSK